MKHLLTFSLFENSTTISPALQPFVDMLNKTSDLFEVDKMLMQFEDTYDSMERGDYDKFHFVLIPEWVRKHWMKDMKYRNESVKRLLYDHAVPSIQKFLKEKGYDSQECFVGYQLGSNKEYEYDNGTFIVGFDLSLDEEHREEWMNSPKIVAANIMTGVIDSEKISHTGWACFIFKSETRFGHNIEFKQFNAKELPTIDSGSGANDSAKGVFDIGHGTFYSYKTESPYNNLADYFGNGEITLHEK